jgi:hypothetical protein
MTQAHPGFRIFVIGAGFSRPAGLPLASEFFHEVRRRVQAKSGWATKFQRDIENYIEYRMKCDGVILDEDEIDLEEFMSYLDIEHFLGLRGSDTWDSEGNESQHLIKRLIGQIIQERTPAQDGLPNEYYEFARRLSTRDLVITFNYDVVLERALEHVGKPYRLFPNRYERVGRFSNIVDSSRKEVVVLKMHGSLDWFNNQQYEDSLLGWKEQGIDGLPKHAIFNDPRRFDARPIVDGPRNSDDPLVGLYRIRRLEEFYSCDYPLATPFILSPSHVKVIYATPFLGFWNGLGTAGGMNLGVSVIGFSLPEHDDYVRLGLFQLISNYQESWWDEILLDTVKDNVKMVDFRQGNASVEEYKERYCFINQSKAAFFLDGFGMEAVEFLFSPSRT